MRGFLTCLFAVDSHALRFPTLARLFSLSVRYFSIPWLLPPGPRLIRLHFLLLLLPSSPHATSPSSPGASQLNGNSSRLAARGRTAAAVAASIMFFKGKKKGSEGDTDDDYDGDHDDDEKMEEEVDVVEDVSGADEDDYNDQHLQQVPGLQPAHFTSTSKQHFSRFSFPRTGECIKCCVVSGETSLHCVHVCVAREVLSLTPSFESNQKRRQKYGLADSSGALWC